MSLLLIVETFISCLSRLPQTPALRTPIPWEGGLGGPRVHCLPADHGPGPIQMGGIGAKGPRCHGARGKQTRSAPDTYCLSHWPW